MSGLSVQTKANTNTSSSTSSNVNQPLDKNSFLKLLIAQLTNQDPTSPMDSAQFVSQMATFTTLEQTQNMSSAIDKLVASQSNQSLSEQAAMIGKKINWDETVTGSDGNTGTKSYSGVIQAVSLKDGSLSFQTDDGSQVDPSSVTGISQGGEAEQSV
ncbi:flagellar hook capping FlgD N-terminal domain-containing protein [Sporolactobacillus inulinus]|uniref:Flagellar hook capping protein n=1 Tax=Sporolactobacillus inulinus CASD TaxID=1069536 RepID=A0A0U1QLX9_9BACL|nr:flagellar hook capping FlgD N-terminal domain-containing protein [Sporolactobacillus inulinus]KLI01817.1 flagellar hook capping protein [Sporolactobacillus inulinus CASD]GEB75901.1 flagellar basal body rod modification protein FlgD [Sporolactobacillus inulinus]